jgi:ribosomal protein S18 acetylase RimI-like enzyme
LWPGDDSGHAAEIASYFEGTLPEPEIALLAETPAGVTSSKVVGVAELSVRPNVKGLPEGPVGYVEGLYVIPAARNRGVAK